MSLHAEKLKIIEEILKLSSSSLIEKLNIFLKKEKNKLKPKGDMMAYAGMMNKKDAADMKRIIEEGCEQIDKHEW